jgi:hypothetical protein
MKTTHFPSQFAYDEDTPFTLESGQTMTFNQAVEHIGKINLKKSKKSQMEHQNQPQQTIPIAQPINIDEYFY